MLTVFFSLFPFSPTAGAGEAGKTTIIKQMKLMHASGFSLAEREAFRGFVFANMVGAMQSILMAMDEHRVAFAERENEVSHNTHDALAGIVDS